MEFHQNNLDYMHMEWPPYSPDRTPIENAWDMLDRAASQVNPKQATKEELLLDLHVQWDNIHQMKIQRLIRSMRKRVCECSDVNRGPTHYCNTLLQLSLWGGIPLVCLLDCGATTGFSDIFGGQDVILVIHVVC